MRCFFVLLLGASALFAAGPLRFSILLDPTYAPKGASGRMLVFMTDSPTKRDKLGTGFSPGENWVAAMEFDHIAPGQTVEFNPDEKAYPKPFSQGKVGDYQFMALLDVNHSYSGKGQDEGDLYSDVIAVKGLNPASAEPLTLRLTKVTPSRVKPVDTENVKLVEFESPLLSKFWGRSIFVEAGVVLPPKYDPASDRRYPTVYHVHGFGGSHWNAWQAGPKIVKSIEEGKSAEMVHVFLNASFATGHHVFADSVNNGPWGQAVTQEFIPFLEQKYKLIAKTHARFLTGHSSGGWSTLWLEVTYPDVFGGTWSTAPDPVDLTKFTGIDATPGSTQNAYRTKDGKPINLVRMNGKEIATMEEFAKQEEVTGEYGGQIASFEWVWSPRGPDGRPMKLFDRATGEQNPEVQKAWQRYDIRRIVTDNWATLGPKLLGKVHIVVGSEDTFHLEEPTMILCDYLKTKGREDVCEIVPKRNHMDLYQPYTTYPAGLAARIDQEMRAAFEAGEHKAQ